MSTTTFFLANNRSCSQKYPNRLKLQKKEEKKRWKAILSQLNAHIIYRRRSQKDK